MIEKILRTIYVDEKEYTYKEILRYIDIKDSEKNAFNRDIDLLQKKKIIHKDKDGKFKKSKNNNIYFGTYEGTRKGFGFLLMNDEKDIFIPRTFKNSAMDKDRVVIKLIDSECTETRKVGEVIYVIERNNKEIVGEFQDSKSFGFVVPRNFNIDHDIFIPKKFKFKAKNSDIVVVKITKWPENNKKPEGIVTEILGKKGENKVDILCVIRKYGLNRNFPEKVNKFLDKLNHNIDEKELLKRRDLRNLPIITIDGKDAKDLDDAVYVENLGENFKLSVHIADVSHYVKYGTVLDKEAFERATSVYLLTEVVPMLPRELSNDLCSLNANTDKLTLSCEMIIDKNGKVIEYDIFESIINTKYRLTYDDVQDVLDNKTEEYKDIKDMLFNMENLATILMKNRKKRGSVNFDFTECKILLDEKENPLDIIPFDRSFSHKIIEEFMLICNETVAEHMFFLKYPFVYRIHDDPDFEKVIQLKDILHNLNYNLKVKDEVYPKQFQDVLDYFEDKDEYVFLSKLILRSMSKARYSPSCTGHFGLSTDYYCHFTSPIRRYPDLIIHRILKLLINGKLDDKITDKLKNDVIMASEHSSKKEREAEEAEREVYDLKKAQFMKDKIDEEFFGIISSVTNFGFFVELLNTVRGLVHVNDINDDMYYFDEKNICLVGQNTKNIFKIGMKVKVKVSKVIMDNNEIYFTLA